MTAGSRGTTPARLATRGSTMPAVRGPRHASLPTKVESALGEFLSYAPVPIPPPTPHPHPYKGYAAWSVRMQEWCEARGVKDVSAFLNEWVERLIRLAGAIDTAGLWRGPRRDPERLDETLLHALRREKPSAYLSHQSTALL